MRTRLLTVVLAALSQIIGERLFAATFTHSYDPLNRLTNAAYSDGARESYLYDAAGNRLSRVVVNPLIISSISSQTATGGVSTVAIPFTVDNPNVPADSLTVQARTSAANLLPVSSVLFGGSSSNRTLTITPPANSSGTATLTVVVNDGSVAAATSFLVTIFPPNHPPVAVNDSAEYPVGESVKISTAKLLANDSDPDGDALILDSVLPSTSGGGTATVDGPWVIYTPSEAFNGTDTVTYSIADGRGGTAIGTVSLSAQSPENSPAGNIIRVETLSNGHKVIHFAGIPTLTYTIQASTNLLDWTTIGSSTAGVNGQYSFEDSDASNFPTRFYRPSYP